MKIKSKIQLFIFSHTIISFLVMLAYAQIASLSFNAIVLHPILVCSLYITLFYGVPRKFLVFSVGLTTTFLLLLYLSNIVAARYWNGVISWSFLQLNASVFLTELQKMPVYIFIALVIITLLLFKMYSVWLASIQNIKKHFGLLPVLPIVVVLFSLFTTKILDEASVIWQGEPLFEFVSGKQKISQREQTITIPDLTKKQAANLAGKRRPNIILIHADALRADRLSAYGNPRKTSPFIDNLINSKTAVKLSQSMSNCSETICGFASVTTSNFSFSGDKPNIFNILRANGYINNFIGTGDLYHGGLDKYLDPKVDNFLRADLNDNYYKHDDSFVIDTLALYPNSSPRPQLFYLRLMSSHKLGTHRQQYKQYQPTTNSVLSMSMFGGDNVQAQINDHDNFALQFDAYVNKIFTIMKEKGYLDNAIVVIFGDHGDAIGEHGYIGHYHSLYQEEIHVPIILWASKGIDLGIKNRMFATLMDIPATLLHYLKLSMPSSFLGLPLQIEQPEKIAYLDSKRNTIGVLYQKRNKLYKLITLKDEYNKSQLFELTFDPAEQLNIQSEQQEITKKLTKVLKNLK